MKEWYNNIMRYCLCLIALLGMFSCTDDVNEPEMVDVTFNTILSDDIQSRALGDGTTVNVVYVSVFDNNDVHKFTKSFLINDVTLTLAKNQSYQIIFWAQYEDENFEPYERSVDLTSITMNNSLIDSFDEAEKMDAFYAVMKNVSISGSTSISVELVRPLCQINVGTTASSVGTAEFIINAPTTFNPLTGAVGGEDDLTFSGPGTGTGTFEVDNNSYNRLILGYVFAPTQSPTDYSGELTINGKTYSFYDSIQLKANTKTNIVGGFTGN